MGGGRADAGAKGSGGTLPPHVVAHLEDGGEDLTPVRYGPGVNGCPIVIDYAVINY